MDLANDERIRRLNHQIQTEEDSAKMMALVKELMRLLDELDPPKGPDPAGHPPNAC